MEKDWDIRAEGRRWIGEELQRRHDPLPGSLEVIQGKLCWSDEERLMLLGALLENVGIDQAVRLGPIEVWRDAVARRLDELA